MQKNIEEHKAFREGLDALEGYLKAVYDGKDAEMEKKSER